jgi:hypothetical protein
LVLQVLHVNRSLGCGPKKTGPILHDDSAAAKDAVPSRRRCTEIQQGYP